MSSEEFEVFKPLKSGYDLAYLFLHPYVGSRALLRQFLVYCEWGNCPNNTSLEDFPNLSLSEAANLIQIMYTLESIKKLKI